MAEHVMVEQWNILCWNSRTSGGEKWNNRGETVEHLLVKLGNVRWWKSTTSDGGTVNQI